jgi:hypothetical protein
MERGDSNKMKHTSKTAAKEFLSKINERRLIK